MKLFWSHIDFILTSYEANMISSSGNSKWNKWRKMISCSPRLIIHNYLTFFVIFSGFFLIPKALCTGCQNSSLYLCFELLIWPGPGFWILGQLIELFGFLSSGNLCKINHFRFFLSQADSAVLWNSGCFLKTIKFEH